ncbi:MarR family winged helix-turn-helix transcriptional regulator [Actinokineospora sp. NBRC 105648]|uniref:MarR family winged helix-turn-helix transcriptional regulator n=1 Tax=Actinokineospora sp. NBRC 105648 TaxID=3032206 RepID=UPI0024A3C5BF|nr:MarR family winged helix-turn-helix transcriptional regulator [Actinokineospora sp. NBRC 105648]GLZ43445.1 transcriptional regulator [Actinokineospora sp. NBRC 105648]
MSTDGLELDDGVRALLPLLPRLVGRAKRIPVPPGLSSLALTPRHLTLLSCLLFDGPMTVNDLAARLGVAPTTASLMVGDLSRKGVLTRHEDEHDRRRRVVGIAPRSLPSITEWLSRGATAWRAALAPLTPAQRALVVDTLLSFESALGVEPTAKWELDVDGK